jgi:hypothetical protein
MPKKRVDFRPMLLRLLMEGWAREVISANFDFSPPLAIGKSAVGLLQFSSTEYCF